MHATVVPMKMELLMEIETGTPTWVQLVPSSEIYPQKLSSPCTSNDCDFGSCSRIVPRTKTFRPQARLGFEGTRSNIETGSEPFQSRLVKSRSEICWGLGIQSVPAMDSPSSPATFSHTPRRRTRRFSSATVEFEPQPNTCAVK